MEESYEDLLGKIKAPRKNSHLIGAANERALVKKLRKWAGIDFARVPSSGGLRWKDGQNIVGDLVCPDINAVFPFSVETKHYAKVTCVVKEGLLVPTCTMYKIWEQAKRDAARENKIPICFIKVGKQKGWSIYLASRDMMRLHIYLEGVAYYRQKPWDSCNGFGVFSSVDLFKIPFQEIIAAYEINYSHE